MSDAASWAGVIIAIGSLIVSIIALIKSLRAQREANGVQRRVVEIEERREQERRLALRQAQLRPELKKTGSGSYRFCLTNHGMAEARNVQVALDGVRLSDHRTAIRGNELPSLVGPGAEVGCILLISMDCTPPFQVDVRWDDDSGVGRSYRTTLTF